MVDGKSVAVGIGVGYQEDPRWAKNQPRFGGGGGGGGGRENFEKPPELYCKSCSEVIIVMCSLAYSLYYIIKPYYYPKTLKCHWCDVKNKT